MSGQHEHHGLYRSSENSRLSYGGGHLWAYLNWAFGLRALGCKVIWLEFVPPSTPAEKIRANIAALKIRLETYGLVNCLALHSCSNEPLPTELTTACLSMDEAEGADLLLELRYNTPLRVVRRFGGPLWWT